MKAYKVTLLIIDFDGLGDSEITNVIANTHYPNHCINPLVRNIVSRDIGEWSDDHPLNRGDTVESEYKRLFGENHDR